MCWRVGAAKMPSSKVIKGDKLEVPISGFDFQSVQQKAQPFIASAQSQEVNTEFVPLELFDTSELGDRITLPAASSAAEPPPEIPGRFVSDEDLEQQLQESFQRGLQDGKNLAERGLLNVFKSLRTAAEELQQLREKVLRDSEDDLLVLTIAVARRVIRQEVAQNRQVVLQVIKAALRGLSDHDELVVRVHPDDLALLTTSQDQTLRQELAAFRFTLKGDSTLQPGCCQVETSLGTVDASFEAQLEEIYRHLVEERAGSLEADPSQQAGG